VERTKDYQKEPKKQKKLKPKEGIKKQVRNTIMEWEITDTRDGKKQVTNQRQSSRQEGQNEEN